MLFQHKILCIALILYLGTASAKAEANETKKNPQLMQTLATLIRNFLNETADCKAEHLAETLVKMEASEQKLMDNCTLDKWETLVHPIYSALSNGTSNATTCEAVKGFSMAAAASDAILGSLCFSKTHVMQCGKESSQCECLNPQSVGNRRSHKGHMHFTEKHKSLGHDHSTETSADKCMIEKECDGAKCSKANPGLAPSGAFFMSLVTIGYFMV